MVKTQQICPDVYKQVQIFRENIKNGDEPPKNNWISFSVGSELACGGDS